VRGEPIDRPAPDRRVGLAEQVGDDPLPPPGLALLPEGIERALAQLEVGVS
jgi:hypothetical protein